MITAMILLVTLIAIMALPAWILMIAWNYVVPVLFHGPFLTFWMALAILVIIGLLVPKS